MIVYLFEKDTKDLKVGEIVIIEGNVYIIHKNESRNNKFISTLYGRFIIYQNRQDLILKQKTTLMKLLIVKKDMVMAGLNILYHYLRQMLQGTTMLN